jgi:hypothetical protein
MSWEDPIVAEVRKIRESLAAKFDYDVAAIFADLRARQSSAGSRLVNLESRKDEDRDAAEPVKTG